MKLAHKGGATEGRFAPVIQHAAATPIDPSLLGALHDAAPDCLRVIHRTLIQLGVSQDEWRSAFSALCAIIRTRLPDFVSVLMLVSLLPVLRGGFCRFYRSRARLQGDAEDLAQTAVLKILDALFGTWPRGNVGAWVTQIRNNVAHDQGRQMKRDAEHTVPLDEWTVPALEMVDGLEVEELLEELLVGAPPPAFDVLREQLKGGTEEEVASRLNLTVDDVRFSITEAMSALKSYRRTRRAGNGSTA